MTTVSSRDFNRDVSAIKRATKDGPVIITDHGKPAHVLMTIGDYERLQERAGRLADRLFDPSSADIELDFPPRRVDERTTDL